MPDTGPEGSTFYLSITPNNKLRINFFHAKNTILLTEWCSLCASWILGLCDKLLETKLI